MLSGVCKFYFVSESDSDVRYKSYNIQFPPTLDDVYYIIYYIALSKMKTISTSGPVCFKLSHFLWVYIRIRIKYILYIYV